MGAREAWIRAAEQLNLTIEKQSVIRKDPQALAGEVDGVRVRVWWLPGGAGADSSDPYTYVDTWFPDDAIRPPGLRVRTVSSRKAKRLLRKGKAAGIIDRDGRSVVVESTDLQVAGVWLDDRRRDVLRTAFRSGDWAMELNDERLRLRQLYRLKDEAEMVDAVMESVRVVLSLS
jgi:hypothetical protein